MKLIKARYEILSDIDSNNILKSIEIAGRTCYKSEDKISINSAINFIDMIIKKGHESVLEHEKITIKFICDRGVSHELVRHRIASFSQESTRYCNYSKDKFGNELTFIIPCWMNITERTLNDKQVYNIDVTDGGIEYISLLTRIQETYFNLLSEGWQPQQARSILPNSLKTEIVVTANLREWREIFRQRTSKAAHPQMRELMCPLLDELKEKLPIIFKDINYDI